jgi:serine/threonine-protein kinase HipA
MLLLVDITPGFDSSKAYRDSRADSKAKLTKLAAGVYCTPDDLADMPTFMKKNAVRIASYMLPNAALSQASAYFHGPIEADSGKRDDRLQRLFVAGNYAKTFTLPCLEIIQTYALKNPKVAQYCQPFKDNREADFGELNLTCSVDELTYLQNFGRRRYHVDRFLSEKSMNALRLSLQDRHGADLPVRLRTLADACGDMGDELDKALHVLSKPYKPDEEDVGVILNEFTVGWHGRKVAKITYDGMSWKYNLVNGWLLNTTLSPTSRPGAIPASVSNMMPEGFGHEAISEIHIAPGNKANMLCASERYMSNIVIVEDDSRIADLPVDRLYGRLNKFAPDGVFKGAVKDVPAVSTSFVSEIKEVVSRISMPRIAGYQAKMAMHLDFRGNLTPADGTAFTHILKFPGIQGDRIYAKGALEWSSMEIARAGGIKTSDFCMVKLSDNSIALLSERFDVARDEDDMRFIAAEDFCSIMGMSPVAKYRATAEQVGTVLRQVSTNFRDDSEELLRQIVANLILENGDFHLKNISVVKIASPTLDEYRSVRLAPAYDIMCTKFFVDYAADEDAVVEMVFKINGKDSAIELDDLIAFAKTIDINSETAHNIMHAVADGMTQRAREIFNAPPPILDDQPEVINKVLNSCERVVTRVSELFSDIDVCMRTMPITKKRRVQI